ncbi:A/G-specific adenine glycosylase [Litorihabitans aurantiacus]|uniref:Adenine DNA glycosylase n=1 Tax=Litorihabitans aurantiacus TaxID=1930061 RepID=A0AA37XCL7_9MICO|nr:A/G-specific adenine glycosylase [Litorihabitans aurantiacus]GMA30316.1 adenine glycosylase [Litorihabitans aurantiacus]
MPPRPAPAETRADTAGSAGATDAPPDVAALHRTLLDWYGATARDLPWRAPSATPWGVLVSEIMLQQTPVVRVEGPWRAWLERWPTPADLAAAPTAEVLRAWGRLGYPRRALRLQQCAAAIVDRHDGVVPADESALLALPGIGSYTAAAVAAFAHGRRAVVLDTNVRRVLGRLTRGEALPRPHLTRGENAAAAALLPTDAATSARWNVAVMELGALVCTARAPRCEECPVRASCAWLAAGRPADEHADRRRTQAWNGTDRQVRGRVMAALRAADGALTREELVVAAGCGDEQALRCLASLVDDGLIGPVGEQDGSYALGG